jgi:hypothetical protein
MFKNTAPAPNLAPWKDRPPTPTLVRANFRCRPRGARAAVVVRRAQCGSSASSTGTSNAAVVLYRRRIALWFPKSHNAHCSTGNGGGVELALAIE